MGLEHDYQFVYSSAVDPFLDLPGESSTSTTAGLIEHQRGRKSLSESNLRVSATSAFVLARQPQPGLSNVFEQLVELLQRLRDLGRKSPHMWAKSQCNAFLTTRQRQSGCVGVQTLTEAELANVEFITQLVDGCRGGFSSQPKTRVCTKPAPKFSVGAELSPILWRRCRPPW